ncbi:AlpA family transcriptional regulator [Pandoraea sp.]|uniref:helix-turn-helix transcriptional regulator n=1 Tax=Pandoraea sp. TaxID=1883445 RepID=UPI0012052EE8|nr:AlpA family phage regulatory protein [Pandoraea sp.]TAL55295.1 MAG: AlpA family phage regulatory protein [Pandoraea sp.]TAM18213.1 MAG: AlpA family phage regulatory protein [Pandoraea sp.]
MQKKFDVSPSAVEIDNFPIIFITRKEVERITGMSRSWIYQAMSSGHFPKPVATCSSPTCSASSVRWILSEVHSWMESKIQARDNPVPKRDRKMRHTPQ